MSIFDDIPLEIGTTYFDKVIIGWNPAEQKYQVDCTSKEKQKYFPQWLSRGLVERHHGQSLMDGVETRQSKPGNSYNTRYFRSKTN